MKFFSFPFFIGIGILLLCSFQSLKATHIIGADLSYEHIAPCTYRVYLTEYFDCSGAFMSNYIPVSTSSAPIPPPNSLEVVPAAGQACASPIVVGTWVLDSYVEVTAVCPGGSVITNCENASSSVNGVAAGKWYLDYDFCNTTCTEYEARYFSCCRNSIVTSGAANEGVYITASIPGLSTPIVNATPTFLEDPAVYICQESPTAVPLGGIDPDGDSLVYQLVPCMRDSVIPVSYGSGFGSTSPLGSSWIVNLDPISGWLTFVPDSTAQLEIGVVCVQVDEYRNGVLVGSLSRDMQIIVTSCGASNPPDIQPIQSVNGAQLVSPDTIAACPGSPLSFSVSATDIDSGDVVTLSNAITASLPGSQATISNGNPAMLTITWTPDTSDFGQTFPVFISANDATCPYPLHTFEIYYIDVIGPCLGATIMDASCNDSIGAIDLHVYGGSAPYAFQWNTGDTTKDLQNLPADVYWVDVYDSSGQLFLTDTFFVNGSNIHLQVSQTTPDCAGNGGELLVQVSGGTAPYSYAWNTGDTTNLLTGISPGGYSILVKDSTGCPRQETFFLSPNNFCFVSVEGTAFYDLDGDCVQDSNEMGIPYMYIEISPGSATFTDANGHYQAYLDTGIFVLEAQPAPGTYWNPVCPANAQHMIQLASFADDTTGLDFAMDLLPVQDLRISGGMGNPAIGGPFTYLLNVYNDGTVTSNATVELELDPLMIFTGTNTSPFSYDTTTHTVTWSINAFQAGQAIWIAVNGSIDTMASLGAVLSLDASVSPIAGDSTPANNVFVDSSSVVGSFDPNDKQVLPAGFGEQGFVEANENEMLYTIRFQNTGNFPAQFVVIRDTIHANLDLSSYQAMAQSHAYTLDVEEDSILVFTFADIDLPDSTSNPAGSQGFVRFKLLHEGSLSLGDQIRNSAAIYFDFNDPVITNEVLNTIYSPMTLDFLHDDPFCPGDSLIGTLVQTGLAPFSYQWSSGLQDSNLTEIMYPTEVLSSGVYSLTVKDALGISVTDSVSITVESLPIAHVGVDIQGLAISFTDSSSFAENWLWDFGDGNTSSEGSPSHLYASGGDYQIRLIVSNECGSDTSFFDISLTTSVEDLFAASVEVMPNPFSEQTMIRFSNPGQEAIRLRVLDMKGKLIYEQGNIRSEEVVFGGSSLSTGIYFFQLQSESKRYLGKLMIK